MREEELWRPQQQDQLWQVLQEFRECFTWSDGEVERTHLVQHVIDMGDAQPIKCCTRRLPLARQQACDEAVEKLLQVADLIEPSDSQWAATVVMVTKPVGWRHCSDYRPLNGITKKDSYPLPRIDDSLDFWTELVSGWSWFSSLHLRSGYYKVPLAPKSRPKTAFCTGRGLWQFKVLCFGLCNAPATFARLMDKVLAGVPCQQCLVYLDDILVQSTSFEASLESLRPVLARNKVAGLKLHPDICHFMQWQVRFLEHRVGGEGISTMSEKVQAVTDWPTPNNQRQLKNFLGLALYYRRFCLYSCSTVSAPAERQRLCMDRTVSGSFQQPAACPERGPGAGSYSFHPAFYLGYRCKWGRCWGCAFSGGARAGTSGRLLQPGVQQP